MKRWINVSEGYPKEGEKVLVVLDYTKYNRGRRVEMASVHFAKTPQSYGGPNALTGHGVLVGTYFAIPAIVHPKTVTHWKRVKLPRKK